MKIAALFLIATLSACTEAQDLRLADGEFDSVEIEWMERGMETAKQMLKDPESAQFRNVFFYDSANWSAVTCGEINGKNSYGGYSGFTRFINNGSALAGSIEGDTFDFTLIDPALDSFEKAWNKLCFDK